MYCKKFYIMKNSIALYYSMTNHPNRSRAKNPASNPKPEEIKAARQKSGLSARQAAERIFCTERAWHLWEAGERRMPPAFFELFLIKTGHILKCE